MTFANGREPQQVFSFLAESNSAGLLKRIGTVARNFDSRNARSPSEAVTPVFTPEDRMLALTTPLAALLLVRNTTEPAPVGDT